MHVRGCAHHEKNPDGMYVVCRAERKCFFTFEPLPQLNLTSSQLVGFAIGVDPTGLYYFLVRTHPTLWY
jgi:hypothetical protein